MNYDRPIDHAEPIVVALRGDPVTAWREQRLDLDLARFHSGRWALQLDAVFARRSEPAFIVAQGVACLAVAWWAQLSPRSYLRMVKGALFLSPLSVGIGQDDIAAAARNGPMSRLPFASVVVADSYPFADRVMALSDGWGSHFIERFAPDDAAQTNRRGGGGDVEARLLALLWLLDGADEQAAAPAVIPFPRPISLR